MDRMETDGKMSRVDLALSRFSEGFSCSQSVLSAFAPDLGLDLDSALRVAAAFGGGMGRTGRTCGAVTGALMALGLKYGATRGDDKATKERTYALAREFLARFEARHGVTDCSALLGADISTAEGYSEIREAGRFKTTCPQVVAAAVEIAEQMGV